MEILKTTNIVSDVADIDGRWSSILLRQPNPKRMWRKFVVVGFDTVSSKM